MSRFRKILFDSLRATEVANDGKYFFKVNTICGTDLSFFCKEIFKYVNEFPEDALWENKSEDGVIVFRITNGNEGILNLKKRFKFSCMNVSNSNQIECNECKGRYEYNVIKQATRQTGRCWWTSLIICLTYPLQIRQLFLSRIRIHLPELHDEIINIISGPPSGILEYSESIRRALYYKWNIGDSPETPPLQEGKNGLNEMLKILYNLNISTCLLAFRNGKFSVVNISVPLPNPEVLIVHVSRQRWVPAQKLHIESIPIINDPGGEWQLQSTLVGNEDAKHQIGLCTCDGNVGEWIVGCSDSAYLGISSTWISCPKQNWPQNLGKLVPILCNHRLISFDPLNYSQECMNSSENCHLPGKTNTEWIYVRSSKVKQ